MLAQPTADAAAAPADGGGRRPGMTAATAGLLTREALEPSFDAATAREASPAGSPRRAAQVPPPRYRDDDTKSSLHLQEEIPSSPGAQAGRRLQQPQQHEGGASGRGGQPAAFQQAGPEALEQRKGEMSHASFPRWHLPRFCIDPTTSQSAHKQHLRVAASCGKFSQPAVPDQRL